jgi:hypothetical protein
MVCLKDIDDDDAMLQVSAEYNQVCDLFEFGTKKALAG